MFYITDIIILIKFCHHSGPKTWRCRFCSWIVSGRRWWWSQTLYFSLLILKQCFSTPFWTYRSKSVWILDTVCHFYLFGIPTSRLNQYLLNLLWNLGNTLSIDIHHLVYTTVLSFKMHLGQVDIFHILVFWNKITLW